MTRISAIVVQMFMRGQLRLRNMANVRSDKNRMETLESRMVRWAMGVSKFEHRRNEEIFVEPIAMVVVTEKEGLEWFVQRTAETENTLAENITCRISNGWKRHGGRPRFRCEETDS